MEDRLYQVRQLTGHNPNLAHKLMSAVNNNGATPLIVAASNIESEDDARVFHALLDAADPPTLMTTTKTGQ